MVGKENIIPQRYCTNESAMKFYKQDNASNKYG